MTERDRTDTDTDIEFEFFDDQPTTERPVREEAPPKRQAKPPLRPKTPGGGGGTPLVRLGFLIGGAIVLAVILILWVTSCRGDGQTEAYQEYMASVRTVVQASDDVGAQLTDVITSRGSSLEEIDQQLAGLAQQQGQVVSRAQQLDPPGTLVQEQASLVESMQLRQSGLGGLAEAFSQVQLATPVQQAGETLAQQAARLVGSDVVYQDLFRARAQEVMRQQDVSGVAVPESSFLSSLDLVSPGSLTQFVGRLTQGGEGGGEAPAGLHGNSVEAVVAQPGDQQLSPTEENNIEVSDQLAFQVAVLNSGDFQEVDLQVRLTIQFSEGPIRKTEPIDVINQGQTKTVVFRDFANITFAEPTTLQVSVEPVPGEENTANNTAEYPVIFTLE